MNPRFHRWLLICSVTAFVLAGLFPPWVKFGRFRAYDQELGYAFIGTPPEDAYGSRGNRIDTDRLFIEWACIGGISLGAWFLSKPHHKQK